MTDYALFDACKGKNDKNSEIKRYYLALLEELIARLPESDIEELLEMAIRSLFSSQEYVNDSLPSQQETESHPLGAGWQAT